MVEIIRKALHSHCVKYIIQGHTDTLLRRNRKDPLRHYIQNNVGVSQGNTISAKLFIIYAEAAIENYTNKL